MFFMIFINHKLTPTFIDYDDDDDDDHNSTG